MDTSVEFWISEHFCAAYVNNDWSGFSDEEENSLVSFIEQFVEARIGCAYEEYTPETNEFGLCAVTDSFGPVRLVRWHAIQR